VTDQISLRVEKRERRGKGWSSRLRKQGRVPAIVYGYEVDPTPVSVDALELYHALHTDAGRNVYVERNWRICTQDPAPGTEWGGEQITFPVVQYDEECPG
jgi:hypothetical protein